MPSISILGSGWLGFPLAIHLSKNGFTVKGSSTTPSKLDDLQQAGIDPFHIQLPETDHKTSFFDSDYLIINIPPNTSRKGVNHHVEGLESILSAIPEKQKIIYVSATSVYPQVNHSIDENHELDLESDRAEALIRAERLLSAHFTNRLTIIRFGGLLGYDRIPGKYYSGKKLDQYEQQVNYIHRDDAIGIIAAILQKEKWGLIINGVAPKHPTKKEVFSKNANDFGFTLPIFENNEQILTHRIIKSVQIEHILDYSFIYPDPLHFFYTN